MATPNIVPRAAGEGGLGTAAKGWGETFVTNTTTSSATQGGKLVLASDDGAVMGDDHRLGVIEFKAAEDTASTISTGARIQSIARDAWDGSNNDADLEFYTTDGTTESKVLTLDADKAATFAGPIIATKPTVTNLGANGSIPITAAFANIDANGSARTGIRFAGTGTAGQILAVNNTGGEALTFHNTPATALLRGVAAAHDTMEANFMGLFISDGSFWNLIAGGVDSQPDVGLTAG